MLDARGKKSRCGTSLSVVPFWFKVSVLDRDSVDVLLLHGYKRCVWWSARKSKISDCQRHELPDRPKE